MNTMTPTAAATSAPAAAALLPAASLVGLRVGVSVSESADLKRLGLLEDHFKLALRELARTVLVSGGALAYGGHLRAGGYTDFLFSDLQQYASTNSASSSRDGPALLVCLAWQEHRTCSLTELKQADLALGLHGQLRCLDLDGNAIPRNVGRGEAAEPRPSDPAALAQGLTALRRYMTKETAARVLLGGKRHGYSGYMPGVLEEAILALQAGQPLYLAGGFGGVTLDIAAAIDTACAGHCPRHEGVDLPLDEATKNALAEVQTLVGITSWSKLNNGLDEAENRQLAVTHRPAEIAALVGLGLGRRASGVTVRCG